MKAINALMLLALLSTMNAANAGQKVGQNQVWCAARQRYVTLAPHPHLNAHRRVAGLLGDTQSTEQKSDANATSERRR